MSDRAAALPHNVTEMVKEGTLHLSQKGALKKNKTYYAALCSTSQSGVARLELYENEKHSSTLQPCFMVVGSDVVKVEKNMMGSMRVPKEQRNAFLVSTRSQHYRFFVESALDCDDWVRVICETLLAEVHGAASCQESKIAPQVNDLYESVDNLFPLCEFMVTLDKKTQPKMRLEGKVKLLVEIDSIAVISLSGKMVVRWMLKHIRSYRHTHDSFIVEAGRSSSLGEGEFSFLTDKGQDIKNLVSKRRTMAKQRFEGTSHHANPSPAAAIGHHPGLKLKSPTVALTYNEVNPSGWENTGIYDTLENVIPSPGPMPSRPHTVGNVVPKEKKSDKVARAASTCPIPINVHRPPSLQSQGNKTPPVKQQSTKVVTDPGIYSEPELITDAWKSYATEEPESEDMDIYSNLDFPHTKV
ncbi:Docking protein 2 [Chionoecetes opilio]|uniref:Docking protein 2 n=1 Tax=Chionoecetes opilio TaxID=41210 RepID=A0A8J4XQS0_CHIOP|nr:Docking protein 2 [Chionoecetes opilio]